MTSELRPAGKTILSCGHEDVDGCLGVSVQFEDEDCVAGEGFVPVTVYAQYCHDCAKTLYYELGKDTGRVEAGLVQEEQAAHLQAKEDGLRVRDNRIKLIEAELAKFKALAETLAGALEQIVSGTYPRPLGKPWRMDASSSKHNRCIHDAWMYEICEGCLDAFVAKALREYKEARDER